MRTNSVLKGGFVAFKVLGVPFDALSYYANNLIQDLNGWFKCLAWYVLPVNVINLASYLK